MNYRIVSAQVLPIKFLALVNESIV